MLRLKRARQVLEKAQSLSPNLIARAIISKPDNQEYITALVTDFQLFKEGVDGEGRLLSDIGGDYSPNTITIKQREGLPTDRVTLFDTGAFYDSFKVEAKGKFFQIVADTVKEDQDLRDRWGEEITNLNEDSLREVVQLLIFEAKPVLLSYILSS